MKRNYVRIVFDFSQTLVLLTLLFCSQPAKGQAFGTGFETYVTNDLYLNGWDFASGQFQIGTGDSDFGRSLQTGNLPINFPFVSPFIIFSGYWFDTGTSTRNISFNWKANWNGSSARRGEWRLVLYDLNASFLGSSSWIAASTSDDVEFAGFSIPASLFPGSGWYYFSIEARRTGTNTGGTSILRFDDFSTDFPTNSDWPELSPNVTVSNTFSVSDAEINEGEQATITFTFEYDEVIASPSERAVRGLEYQIELHAGLDYVSHSITGSSAGSGTSYNSSTGIFTIEAIEEEEPLTLEITVEGTGDCPDCEIELTVLNGNELQPMTGFGNDIEILSVLPIELIYFRAEPLPSQKAVRLDWATAMELDNDFFTIERSIDGLNFYKVADVPGAGTHSGILEYSFTDVIALEGTSYYRLKQTDVGSRGFSYSEVVRVQLPFGKQDVTPYPNPVHPNEKLQFALSGNWDETSPVELMVFSQNGSLMHTLHADLPIDRIIRMDIPSVWSPGTYVIKVRQGVYQTSKKLIINP